MVLCIFKIFLTADNPSIVDLVRSGCFKLQPGEYQHDGKKDDTHGACPTDTMISNGGVIQIQGDDMNRLDRGTTLCEKILGAEGFQTLEH